MRTLLKVGPAGRVPAEVSAGTRVIHCLANPTANKQALKAKQPAAKAKSPRCSRITRARVAQAPQHAARHAAQRMFPRAVVRNGVRVARLPGGEIRVRTHAEGSNAVVTVADTGQGNRPRRFAAHL